MKKTDSIVSLDLEWIRLILQAKGLGLETEEVRFFLEGEQQKN